jgi:hypothetical protein
MLDGNGDDDVIRFRRIRTLDGRLEAVDLIRRNGHPVPRLDRSVFGPPGLEGQRSDLLPLYREIMYGLSRLERRTWLPLLLDRSIDEVAQSQGVSRAAIYARIRGNSKKQGGMIRKNDYVAIWWRTQRNLHLRKKHA